MITSLVCGILYYIAREMLNYYILNILWYNFSDFNLIEMIWQSTYMFITWSVMYLGFKTYNEWLTQKKYTEHALLLAKTAQLEMLKYQLNPHFLFNSLSALRGMIISEPIKAKEMVTQISEILRYTLIEGKNDMVPLLRELEVINLYLSIEKKRFEDDLIMDIDVSPNAKNFIIPVFLIHPLVENAVKHGMRSGVLPLEISIKISCTNNTLLVEIKNNGKWIENNQHPNSTNTGTGLDNIKKRLSIYYPGNYSFVIIKDPQFVLVKIKINN
ncbi:MAG: histidine kinase [bacterium]